MESRRQQKRIPLGCRFVPYDQWFVTHIETTWKIKHVKQMILAKCFGLPFDPRKFIRDNTSARAPSPITFAPDESTRPVSPIQFATPQEVRKKRSAGGPGEGNDLASAPSHHAGTADSSKGDDGERGGGDEGYEEDDEWDDDDDTQFSRTTPLKPVIGGRVDMGGKIELATPVAPLGAIGSPLAEKPSRKFNPLSKLTGSSGNTSSSNQNSSNTSSSHASSGVSQNSDFAVVDHKESKKEPEIQTHNYTLIRFSTGQILEDDFLVSWYDLVPNELVELHASSTAISFEVSLAIPQLLLDPNYRSSTSTLTNDPRTQNVATDTTFFSTGITLTSLPRQDPVAYAEPYWEGWVRALRVVWQSEMPSAATGAGKNHSSYQDYAAGMTNFQNSMAGGLAVFVSEPGLFPEKPHHSRDGARMKKKLEWRERWVVIRDGTINLCKTRYDLTPTHCLPLASILSLRDASHLIHTGQSKSKPTSTTRPRSKTLKSGDDRDRRSHRRSISQPRSSTSTAKDYRHRDDRSGRNEPGAARGLTVDSPRRSDRSSQHLSDHFTAPMSAADIAHRRAEIEQQQRARQRAREQRQKQEMELEYLKNWDDVGLSFKRKKDKGKEKEKERGEKGKGRELDHDRGRDKLYKSRRVDPESSAYTLEREQTRSHKGYTEHEREREREREREKEKERDRERERDRQRRLRDSQKAERDKFEEKWGSSDKTFIPHTREEAEAAGMKIICAKFKTLRVWESQQEPAKKTTRSAHRYTNTGPSLAGDSGYVNESDVTENPRSRKDTNTSKAAVGDDVLNNHQHSQSQIGPTLQNIAPRKTSLPLIHLSSNKHSSQSLMLNSPPAITNPLLINSSSSTTKFGITGLFSKDRIAPGLDNLPEDPNPAKKEKEERKREEKERKAREKEQKLLEKKAKEREKGKRKDETGDEEETTANALTWKLGKKKSGKVKEESLGDVGFLSDSVVASSSATLNDACATVVRPVPLSINTVAGSSGYSSSVTVGENVVDSNHLSSNTLEDAPTTPVMRVKPKLTLSPIPDSATQAKAEQSDSDSSSCSLSSPVFHHSGDSDESLDELDADARGPLANTRRAERKGYRYGGYHDRKQEGKRKVKSDAGHGPRPSVIGVFEIPEPHKPSEKGKEREKPENLSSARPQESRSHSHDRADDRKRKEDDRGEWIVLDMGSDHAFNSILRIFHRYFSQPLSSNFIPPSMAAAAIAAHAQSTADVPQSPTSIYQTQSVKSDSNINSPVLSHFWSSTTLARGSDDASIFSDRSGLRSTNVASSSNLRSVYSAAAAPENEEDDDIYADPPKVPISQPSRESLQHPTTLKTASQPQKRSSIVPALPYPEWRRELVHRARRHGMRDANRPLDLALNGWGRDFDEMDLESVASRLHRRKEEEQRRSIRDSYIAPDIYGYGDQMYLDDSGATEDDGNDGDVEHEPVEEGIEPVAKPGRDDGRRMSQISHVSTIKAAEINAAAAASIRSNQSILESAGTLDEDEERGSDDEEQWQDAESVGGYKDNEYEPKYGYGYEDAAEAMALGVDSMLDDSDEEDESETEWTAWLTDLPRQMEARKELKNMEARRREEQEELKRQELLHKQGYKSGEKPLSPMIFSNPFTEQQQAPPLEVDDLCLGDPHYVPKTQEEERRQYLASRIQLEPTIMISTTIADPLQFAEGSAQQHGVAIASISSVLGSDIANRYYTGAQQTHLNRFTNRTVSALSSRSSSESLGNVRSITTHNFSSPSNEPQNFLPLSPVSSDPLDDDADRDQYPGSSSTSPPSASYLVSATHSPQNHRRSHSRSVSGSDFGQQKLHHSSSMPLGPGSRPPLVRGHGSSVPSSPPHSPTIPSSLTKAVIKKTMQPVSMPILTQAQINEIESETAERMRQLHPAGGFQPNAMSSSSSSFVPKSIAIPMPRRSSSAGYSGSGSPPSSAGAAINLSASLGSAGSPIASGSTSIGRSASLLAKPVHGASGVPNERGERERGVLKKKPSDLGKERERGEGDISAGKGKQRPKLSLAGLGGASSSAASSSSAVVFVGNQQNYNVPEVHSPTGQSSMKAFLRRVRSGSSLRLDRHPEEDGSPPVPLSPTISTREGREMSPPPGRRRIGTMDRLVRGLDSALEFVEGR